MLPTACKICKEEFDSNRELNKHIRSHKLTQSAYYEQYHPRKCAYSLRNIPFSDVDKYFSSFFLSKKYQDKYFEIKITDEARQIALQMLQHRIQTKGYTHAPTALELKSLDLPSIPQFSQLFGSYGLACRNLSIPMLFPNKPNGDCLSGDANCRYERILIDSREQNPLVFEKSEVVKLDVGDYTLGGKEHTNTFVDRKSESDFKGTFASGISRFKRELDRCRKLRCFLWVVVECEFEDLEKNNHWGRKSSNLSYIYHNMRDVQHNYGDCCQIIFTGSRKNSEYLIPRLLIYGEKLWKCDMQYFFEKYNVIH